jgi:hypothetical protein
LIDSLRQESSAKAAGKDGKDKESAETSLKRSRSSSLAAALGPQRVPLGPGRVAPAQTVQAPAHTRTSSIRVQKPPVTRAIQRKAPAVHNPPPVQDEDDIEQSMDIEDASADEEDPSMGIGADQVEAMIDARDDDEEDEDNEVETYSKPSVWPQVSPQRAERYKREVEAVRAVFEDEQDMFDTTMVSEYAEEIFVYMNELEVWSYRMLLLVTHPISRRALCLTPTTWMVKMISLGRCVKPWSTGFCKCTCATTCFLRPYG